MVRSPDRLDLDACEDLAARGAAGDASARDALIYRHFWPVWLGLVRGSRFLGRFRESADAVEDIRTRLVAKVQKTLRTYPGWRAQERNRAKSIEDWNRIAVANVIRRYVKERIGDPLDALVESDPSLKGLLNEFAVAPVHERIGVRPPMTMAQTAAELVAFARGRLAPQQFRALGMWLHGATFEEMASELGLVEARDAENLQRAAIAALRRQFREAGGGSEKNDEGA